MYSQWLPLVVNVVIFAAGVPMAFGKVPPNRMYGFRTKTTLSRPDIWYRANAFAGRAMMVATAAAMPIALFMSEFSLLSSIALIVVPVFGATAAAYIYLKCIA